LLMIELSQLVTALILGLFVGSLLTEAVILVPYWRKLKPENFLELHSTLGPQLYSYYAPLTISATVVPVLNAIVGLLFSTPTQGYGLVVAVLVLLILGIYFFYFQHANASFKTGSVGTTGLPAELERWARWHWLRTGIALVAFALALFGLRG
jgi:Domain of unknown function (DUF1772)